MSTKIYDAYEYKPEGVWLRRMGHLFPKLLALRKRVWSVVVPNLTASIDPMRWDFVAWMDDFREVVRSQQNCAVGKRGNFIDNPSCSAVVYPFGLRLFVQFFGLPRNIKKPFPGLVDFHYQNQVDMPRNVTANEWRERRRIWDRILGDEGVPSISGLSYDFVSASDNLRLASLIFERLHKHRMYPGGEDKAAESCPICVYRRGLYKKEQEAKQ